MPNIGKNLDPSKHGWIFNDGHSEVKWVSQKSAPEALLEFPVCKCRKHCNTDMCPCFGSGFHCTNICTCKHCDKKDFAEVSEDEDNHMIELQSDDIKDEFDSEEEDTNEVDIN